MRGWQKFILVVYKYSYCTNSQFKDFYFFVIRTLYTSTKIRVCIFNVTLKTIPLITLFLLQFLYHWTSFHAIFNRDFLWILDRYFYRQFILLSLQTYLFCNIYKNLMCCLCAVLHRALEDCQCTQFNFTFYTLCGLEYLKQFIVVCLELL